MFSSYPLTVKPNERILIAPHSPMTEVLCKTLLKNPDFRFVGYLDANKQGEDIYTLDTLDPKAYDRILLLSPNHSIAILKNLKKHHIPAKKIAIVISLFGEYLVRSHLATRLSYTLSSIYLQLLRRLQPVLKPLLERQDSILFIAPDFVDINVKEFYIHLDNTNRWDAIIATNNIKHLQLLKPQGFRVVMYPSLSFIWHALKAKVIVMDHTPIDAILKQALQYCQKIQMWHGIPLKKIGGIVNYKDVHFDLVVSTSTFVTEYAFSKVFASHDFVHSGYPRNDVLVSGVKDKRTLAMVEMPIYEHIKKNNFQTIIYMPTYRENSFASNPIDFDKLNIFAKESNLFILIKLHPFNDLDYFDKLDDSRFHFHKNYSERILFYPTGKDIYPLLHESALLITDYSSIYFDYLLLDKPIIFFVYDKDEYTTTRGDFMLDFESSTPGTKCITFDALLEAIQNNLLNDTFKQDRLVLRKKLFETHHSNASEMLEKALTDLVDR